MLTTVLLMMMVLTTRHVPSKKMKLTLNSLIEPTARCYLVWQNLAESEEIRHDVYVTYSAATHLRTPYRCIPYICTRPIFGPTHCSTGFAQSQLGIDRVLPGSICTALCQADVRTHAPWLKACTL